MNRTGTEAGSKRSSMELTITLLTYRVICLDKTLAHLLHDWVADEFAWHLKGHHDFRPLLRPGRTGISTGRQGGTDKLWLDSLAHSHARAKLR